MRSDCDFPRKLAAIVGTISWICEYIYQSSMTFKTFCRGRENNIFCGGSRRTNFENYYIPNLFYLLRERSIVFGYTLKEGQKEFVLRLRRRMKRNIPILWRVLYCILDSTNISLRDSIPIAVAASTLTRYIPLTCKWPK